MPPSRLRPPEPGSFEHLLREARLAADSLVRLSRYPKTEPWWSRGVYRFDGPSADETGGFGTCYASPSLDVAFCESVIHDSNWWRNGRYQVTSAALIERHVVPLRRPARPELVLADFTGAALKVLGLNNDISSGDRYAASMAWARAVHGADPKWDGILYVSRQLNDGVAVALFERSGVRAGRTRRLRGVALAALCTKYGVLGVDRI